MLVFDFFIGLQWLCFNFENLCGFSYETNRSWNIIFKGFNVFALQNSNWFYFHKNSILRALKSFEQLKG